MKRILMTAGLLLTATTTYAVMQNGEESACFQAINDFRAQHGLPALQWSDELANASRNWSSTMRRTGRFLHSNNRNGAGENIARGREDGLYTFNQWKNSSGHRAFLLSRNTTEAGVGQDGTYWTFRARAAERKTVRQPETRSANYTGDVQYRTVSQTEVQEPQRLVRRGLFRRVLIRPSERVSAKEVVRDKADFGCIGDTCSSGRVATKTVQRQRLFRR